MIFTSMTNGGKHERRDAVPPFEMLHCEPLVLAPSAPSATETTAPSSTWKWTLATLETFKRTRT